MITIEYKENTALISGECILPEVVFECGQAFRFDPDEQGVYTGVAHGRLLNARAAEEGLLLWPVTPEDMDSLWRRYFDLHEDYTALCESFTDPILHKAVCSCSGLRLLNQEPFETVISFIVSANNNIKRIKLIIRRLCERWGEPIAEGHYAFPTPDGLCRVTEAELHDIGLGYRAPYIAKSAAMLADGTLIEQVKAADSAEAKRLLMTLPGVGPKVADCALLFGFGRRSAFPKDVWIRRVLNQLYGQELKSDKALDAFVSATFGENAGLAQQYLFHFARTSGLQG